MQCLLTGIISITDKFNKYIPALILLLIKSLGFSTNFYILWYSFVTTTPNRLGSSTVAKTIEAAFPWALWNLISSANGKSQIISLLRTNIIYWSLLLRRTSSENLRGPAVPRASGYWAKVSFILYFYSISIKSFLIISPK